jgi:arylsulfatase A-like enzyme
LDWLPTIVKLAGVELNEEWKLEGRDVWPLLSGTGVEPTDPLLYWNIGKTTAIMDGDWKLIVPGVKGKNPELYDVKTDSTEKEDRAADKPDIVAALRKKLDTQAKMDPQR